MGAKVSSVQHKDHRDHHILIEAMTAEEIATIVSQLGVAYEKYSSVIIAYEINGSKLLSMNEDINKFLTDLGIISKVHQTKITQLLLQYYAKRLEYYSKRISESILGKVEFDKFEEEEELESCGMLEFDQTQSKIQSKTVIEDVVTTDPRSLMTNIFKFQGIPLDPSDIDPCVTKLIKVIGHCEACDGVEYYDCFINYRVASDANTAMTLYLELKTKGMLHIIVVVNIIYAMHDNIIYAMHELFSSTYIMHLHMTSSLNSFLLRS